MNAILNAFGIEYSMPVVMNAIYIDVSNYDMNYCDNYISLNLTKNIPYSSYKTFINIYANIQSFSTYKSAYKFIFTVVKFLFSNLRELGKMYLRITSSGETLKNNISTDNVLIIRNTDADGILGLYNMEDYRSIYEILRYFFPNDTSKLKWLLYNDPAVLWQIAGK